MSYSYGTSPFADRSALGLVNDGWGFFQGKSSELLQKTQSSLNAIAEPLYNLTAPVITFDMPALDGGTFLRPTAPAPPSIIAIDTTVPDAPVLGKIILDALPVAPSEPDFTGMAYAKPAAPSVQAPIRPSDTDVSLVDITIPDAPAFVMPDNPTLYALNLPTIPDLEIPEFEGIRPTFNLSAPTDALDWAYEAYDGTLITSIQSQLSSMRINGLALPPAIEQAIFDRARGREDVLSLQQEHEASRLFAQRGMRHPAGLFNRALTNLRDKARLTSSGASRDLGIEISKENIESIRFGLSQAIALESTLLQSHVQEQGLLLDAAKATHVALIEVFNSQVALHNAQWEGFKAEASVYESKIRALAAQADVLKTRIEAEKVKADVNEGLVRAYGERIRALSALADMFRAQVDAAKAKGEINIQRLEQVRLRLQVYGVDVDSYSKQWDVYRTQVDAEATGLRYFETQANVYGQRVNAWRGQVEAQDTRARSQIAVQGQSIEVFKSTIAGILARVQAQTANVDANVRVFQAQTSLFGTEGQVSAAESAAGDRTAELKLGQYKLQFDGAARNAEIAGNYGLKQAELAIEGHRGAAQVWGQLASSVLSGVNLGASASYGESMGWSWSGEIN